MGGAGGHMWHPFDCPDVNSGQDLIDFFRKSIDAIRRNPAALKIDGVNLSFRLKENPGTPTGFEFVIDRGSMKPLDVEGVTADNADQRFVTKDGSPHGMVEATRILLGIFNSAIPEIMPELEQLGMTRDTGPFSLYFNTEFVLKKINVKEYPFNFIAIHGVNKFVQKGPKSRQGVGVEADQGLLDQIKEKVQVFANEKDFRVYTKIPANVKKSVLLEDALNEEFTIVYKSFAKDPEEPGEMGAGEGSTKPIKVWLLDVHENPINKIVNITDQMRQHYPQMGKKQSPYAKNIYLEILKGTAVSDIATGPEDVEALVDAVIVMHASRVLGNAVLDALESDEFGSAREQEGVVVHDSEICGGSPFKFTGDFIVGGLATSFRETKYKKGPLLESFIPEPMNLGEQEDRQYVILIPGGFKPPTGGHYHLIKEYDKNPNVRKVFVVTGAKEREGVTLQQSKEIFDVYGGFSDKVDFIMSDDPTPLTTCYELVKNENFVNQFPNLYFSIGAGDKGGDPIRIKQFVDYFNKNPNLTPAEVHEHPPATTLLVDGQPASASRLRKAFVEEDWEIFKKLLPHDSFYDDVVQILNNQGGGRVNENFLLAVPQSFLDEGRKKKKKTKVSKSGQERVSKKIGYLISKEKKDKKQAAAIAYSMEKRGHIAEQAPGAEPGETTGTWGAAASEEPIEQKQLEYSDQLKQFKEEVQKLLAKMADELGITDMVDTKEKEEYADSMVATVHSLLSPQVAEASSMGAGDVVGSGGGNAWLSKQDDKTLIGEEDDE
jgi:hypothetical protein